MKRLRFMYFLMTICVGLAACLVLAVSPSEKQQLENFKVSTLKGLSAVAVTVKIVRDDPNTLATVKEQELQGEVALALQSAGVSVAPPRADVGLYVVLVKVARGGKDGTLCGVHVQSSLLQIVQLARDTTIRTEAQTWPAFSQGRFGLVSIAVARTMVIQSVKDQVKDFANDWKAANPKP